MKRSFFSLPFRSDSDVARLLLGSAVVVLCVVGPVASAATVAGTVTVERAKIRSDGPKHDRDLVITLRRLDGPPPKPKPSQLAIMDQKRLVFLPHVLAIQQGTTVRFLNSDSENHNVYFLDDKTGETLDIGTWGPGISVDHTFKDPGAVIVLCKLHLEMAAYVIVSPGPWFAQTEVDESSGVARFAIENVPEGEYEMVVWHKKLKLKGGPRRVKVGSGSQRFDDLVVTRPQYAR